MQKNREVLLKQIPIAAVAAIKVPGFGAWVNVPTAKSQLPEMLLKAKMEEAQNNQKRKAFT